MFVSGVIVSVECGYCNWWKQFLALREVSIRIIWKKCIRIKINQRHMKSEVRSNVKFIRSGSNLLKMILEGSHAARSNNKRVDKQGKMLRHSSCIIVDYYYSTGCHNKKETGINMPVSLKLDKLLNIFAHYLLEGYLLFPTVPRNVGSVLSVNEHEHFKDRLKIWICTKMLRLRLVPSLQYLRTFFQMVDFTGTGRPGNWWANLFPTFCKLPIPYHSVTVKTLCSFVSYIMKCAGISNLLAQ